MTHFLNYISSIFFVIVCFTSITSPICAQLDKGGLPYVITTGVPFMRIATDARSSGMAEVGVSTSADNNSGFHNPAKFAFIDKDMGASINFAPWLRQITNDIYLINANGYAKIAPDHTAGLSLRYFTLGQITYTNQQGTQVGLAKPFEFTAEGHYAFRLAENFSIGSSARYIMSDLSNGSTDAASTIPVGTAFSVDFAAFYSKKLELRNFVESKINIGMNISNIGSKIQYRSASEPDYIPTNLALGATFEGSIDDYNSFSGTLQFDKLLVPTPTYTVDVRGQPVFVDQNQNSVADYKELGSIAGILSSFGDHGEGIGGELREVIVHLGAEYAYQKTYFVRGGFFYEPESSGGRNFVTLGLGIKYNTLKLDFSYLLPISQQRSPLDNQMRVSLGVNVGETKSKNSNYW
jgi:hypothetical protein